MAQSGSSTKLMKISDRVSASELIYTAVTRGKKLVTIIGQPKALAMAVKNRKSISV
jgi:ATP-dependent exoDNAse (exonuclease V) alpha subunit